MYHVYDNIYIYIYIYIHTHKEGQWVLRAPLRIRTLVFSLLGMVPRTLVSFQDPSPLMPAPAPPGAPAANLSGEPTTLSSSRIRVSGGPIDNLG